MANDDRRLDTTLSNHRWLMLRIAMAETERELEEILIDIECDKFEDEPWTKDKTKLSQLRNKYVVAMQNVTASDASAG